MEVTLYGSGNLGRTLALNDRRLPQTVRQCRQQLERIRPANAMVDVSGQPG